MVREFEGHLKTEPTSSLLSLLAGKEQEESPRKMAKNAGHETSEATWASR